MQQGCQLQPDHEAWLAYSVSLASLATAEFDFVNVPLQQSRCLPLPMSVFCSPWIGFQTVQGNTVSVALQGSQ